MIISEHLVLIQQYFKTQPSARNSKFGLVVGVNTWTVTWPDQPTWTIEGLNTNTGTYTYSGNTATLFVNNNTVGTGTISGNTLTLLFTGVGSMTLSK